MPESDRKKSLDTQSQPASRSADALGESGTNADREKRPEAGSDDNALESIGKAVSSPLLGSEEDERAKERPAEGDPRTPGGRTGGR